MNDSQPVRLGDLPVPAGMPAHLLPIASGREKPSAELLALADALEAQAERDAIDDMRARQRAFRERAWDQSCPAPFRQAALDGIEPPQDRGGVVTGWLDQPLRNLILTGSSRRGKSHVAYAIGNEARRRGQWVAGFLVTDLLECLRPSEVDPARSERTRQTVRGADLLILDDLGPESQTPWTVEQLWDVLEARIATGTRLIATTNLSYAELERAYGPRIVYRLVENAVIVKFEGPPMKPAPLF